MVSDQEFDREDSFHNEEEENDEEVPTLILNTHQDIDDDDSELKALQEQNTGQYNSSMAAALTSI